MECLLIAWTDNIVIKCEEALSLIDSVNKRVKEVDPNIHYEAEIISRVSRSIKREIVEQWGRLGKLDPQKPELRLKSDIVFDIFKDARMVKDCLRNIADKGIKLMTPNEQMKLNEIAAKLEFLSEQIQFLNNVLIDLMTVDLVTCRAAPIGENTASKISLLLRQTRTDMQQRLQPILFPAENALNTDNSQVKEVMASSNDISDYRTADPPDPQPRSAKSTTSSYYRSSSRTTAATIPQVLPGSDNSLPARITSPDAPKVLSSEDRFLIPMEPEFIQYFQQVGTNHFNNGDYTNAKKYLEESLKHAEMRYGKQFDGKEDVMKRLRASYWVLRDWKSLRKMLTNTVNENSENSEKMIEDLQDLSELYSVAPPIDLISAERICREAIQKKIKFWGTQEHGSVYESLELLVRILDAKGEYSGAETYRSLVPAGKLASYRLKTWCSMSKEFAAAQLNSRFILNLILFGKPSLDLDKRDSIRQNILKSGVLGSTGLDYTIGHALIQYGREEALQFLLKRGFSVETMDDKQNTLLATAVYLRKQDSVRLLLENGADINAPCHSSWRTHMSYAIERPSILKGAVKCVAMRGNEEILLMLRQCKTEIKTEVIIQQLRL